MTILPDWARNLGLRPHPEGGWYAETYRSPVTVAELPGYPGPRCTATVIYFLLMPGERSARHVVRSDEIWFHHRGGALRISVEGPSGTADFVLGTDIGAGQQPQVLVPGGHWQSAIPVSAEPVLVSCLVSPGFEFDDFTMDRSPEG